MPLDTRMRALPAGVLAAFESHATQERRFMA